MMSLVTSRSRAAIIAVFLGALAAFPLLGQEFYTELVTRVMILSIFAISLDLLVGYTGLISFGHAAWFGMGGGCELPADGEAGGLTGDGVHNPGVCGPSSGEPAVSS